MNGNASGEEYGTAIVNQYEALSETGSETTVQI
jgi:hypothetical protein